MSSEAPAKEKPARVYEPPVCGEDFCGRCGDCLACYDCTRTWCVMDDPHYEDQVYGE